MRRSTSRLCTLCVRLGEHHGAPCVKGASWEAFGRTLVLLTRRAVRQWETLCEAGESLGGGAREECMHSSARRRSAGASEPQFLIDVREMDFSGPS